MKSHYLLLMLILVNCTKDDDLVDHNEILRLTNIDFKGKMYSGYLAATDGGETQFHYYFQTTTNQDPQVQASAPVILWLNGGPGCSSLQGSFNEIGPFVFETGTTDFIINEYAWTTFADVLYLESPGKVGYSYGEAVVDDDIVAKQNLHALLQFFERFPELQQREFFIAGESYAGVYIPTLAYEILQNNQIDGALKINIKGIAVGNGCTDPTECSNVADVFPMHVINYLGGQGFLSEKQREDFLNLMASGKCDNIDDLDPSCGQFAQGLLDYLEAPKSFLFNPYNIYGRCWNYKVSTKRNDPMLKRIRKLFTNNTNIIEEEYGSCTDDAGLYHWFRMDEWNAATHIKAESPIWEVCTGDEQFKYKRLDKQSYYLYDELIGNIRIMHFSGDIDAVVPITGTLYWINKFQNEYKIPTIESWRPWFVEAQRNFDNQQNAGNVWTLDGLMLVTVRNAGHMVPTDRRQQALTMIHNFVVDQPLPQ